MNEGNDIKVHDVGWTTDDDERGPTGERGGRTIAKGWTSGERGSNGNGMERGIERTKRLISRYQCWTRVPHLISPHVG